MDAFHRVYFDTNVLIIGGWPAADSDDAILRPILELARSLKVGLIVPEPVRMETEMVWLRELHKTRKDDAAKAQARGVVNPELLSTPWDRIRDSYRNKEKDLITAWGFNQGQQAGFPVQTMPDAFRDSIDSEPPYEGRKEHGFRDSVIYLSVVEHLQRDPAVSVLVTDDKFFPGVNDERERTWREGRGVNLRIIHSAASKSLEALKADLEEMQLQRETPERKTWRQQDEEHARAAFEAKGNEELRAYIQSRLRVPSSFPYRFEYPEVASAKVERVVTTASQGTADGSRIRLTATVRTEFRAQSMRRVTPTDAATPTLGYGLPTQEIAYTSTWYRPVAPSMFSDYRFSFNALTGTVLVGASAVFHPDRYEDLKFESAVLSSWEPP